MNLSPETLNYILAVIAVVSTIFAVWNAIKKPQEELETKQAISEKDIANRATLLAQKEMESKAEVLAKQFQWEREANEKRFIEVGSRLEASTNATQKEMHAIDLRLQVFITSQNDRNEEISKSLVKIFTILEERLAIPIKG